METSDTDEVVALRKDHLQNPNLGLRIELTCGICQTTRIRSLDEMMVHLSVGDEYYIIDDDGGGNHAFGTTEMSKDTAAIIEDLTITPRGRIIGADCLQKWKLAQSDEANISRVQGVAVPPRLRVRHQGLGVRVWRRPARCPNGAARAERTSATSEATRSSTAYSAAHTTDGAQLTARLQQSRDQWHRFLMRQYYIERMFDEAEYEWDSDAASELLKIVLSWTGGSVVLRSGCFGSRG